MEKANSEPMFQSNPRSIVSIDGSALKALKIAYDKFVLSGKDMREFNITISEEINKTNDKKEVDGIFNVTFMGKLMPGKRGLGTENCTPGSVTYFISREKWIIIKEQGIK